MEVNDLWISDNEALWKSSLDKYWDHVLKENINLEKEINEMAKTVSKFTDIEDWYTFLFEKYFPWKYTAANRLATARGWFEREYDNDKEKLNKKVARLFEAVSENHRDTSNCLKKATGATGGIKGLGVAGGSGLLAILFPNYFATVDQFIAKNIVQIDEFKNHAVIIRLKGRLKHRSFSFTIKEGVVLIEIMRNKAKELNSKFRTDFWTPRKIDMVLWGIRIS